jgi:hypothetical protein
MNKQIEIANRGTAAFPIFAVLLNTIDEQGFDLEHLSEELARFPSLQAAQQFAATI